MNMGLKEEEGKTLFVSSPGKEFSNSEKEWASMT